jgi:hypothetical protein
MEKIKPIIILLSLFLVAGAVRAQSVGGSLKGKLYYDLGNKNSKIAAGLKVWLIPNIAQNSKIITKSATYEASCSESTLRSAVNYKVAITDKDGYYFFPNVTTGKYLLKICAYYGGYYSFTIKSNFTGTYNLPDFEADPPIRNSK